MGLIVVVKCARVELGACGGALVELMPGTVETFVWLFCLVVLVVTTDDDDDDDDDDEELLVGRNVGKTNELVAGI